MFELSGHPALIRFAPSAPRQRQRFSQSAACDVAVKPLSNKIPLMETQRISVVAFSAALVAFTFASSSSVAAQKARTLRQNHEPLVSRLLPDDEVVIVEHLTGPPFPPPVTKTRETELKDLNRWQEIAVIHQAVPQSSFAMKGTWLKTTVQARVLQTLKTGPLATAPGKPIEFMHEGGELKVNGVTIRSAAGLSFDPNSRYLAALRFDSYEKEWQPVAIFELDNLGSLRGSRRREGSTPPSALHGLKLPEVADALSKGAK